MRTIPILILLLLFNFSFGQKKKDYLISFSDISNGKELIGYKNKSGEIIIKPQFPYVYTDTLYTMAIVLKNWEWVGIDKKEKIILKPFIYDNGPDYIVEGLFRFVENDKIGFADINGKKIIKAKYDFATPFENGLSEYTLGGHEEYYEEDKIDWDWVGGYEKGFVNHKGQEFIKVTELKNDEREAWTKNGKHLLLNKEGQIIKRLK